MSTNDIGIEPGASIIPKIGLKARCKVSGVVCMYDEWLDILSWMDAHLDTANPCRSEDVVLDKLPVPLIYAGLSQEVSRDWSRKEWGRGREGEGRGEEGRGDWDWDWEIGTDAKGGKPKPRTNPNPNPNPNPKKNPSTCRVD